MTTPIARLLQHILNYCDKAGVTVDLQLADNVAFPGEGAQHGDTLGYYDDEKRQILVAIQDRDWFLTLAHEFCHFLQVVDGRFTDHEVKLMNFYDEWLVEGIEHPDDLVEASARLCQECELDCEKRTVKLLQSFDVPLNYGAYVQDSNAYVLTYELARRHRKWSPPGSRVRLAALMPTEFVTNLTDLPAGFDLEEAA